MSELFETIKKYSPRQKKILLKRLSPFIAVILVVIIAIICLLVAVLSPNKKDITKASVIVEKGDYKAEKLFCETLSDEAYLSGWRYYFVEDIDSGAIIKNWECDEDEATIAIGIKMTNLSKEPTAFSDRMNCKLYYNENVDVETSILQENPNQRAEDGGNCRSTACVPIEPNGVTKIWFLANVPKEMRDSDKPFKAVIKVDKDTYTVNLREDLKIFSE